MEPSSLGRSLSAGPAHDRHGPNNQEPPDVALPHLRGFSENLLAPGRMLPGNEPEPCGKVAPAFEDLHRRREGLNRQGSDRPDARRRFKTPRCLAALGFES